MTPRTRRQCALPTFTPCWLDTAARPMRWCPHPLRGPVVAHLPQISGCNVANVTPAALHVIVEGRLVGVVTQSPRTNQLAFAYDAAWRDADGAFPVSLSMPLAGGAYGDAPIRLYLDGLLPDREEVRRRIAQDHHIAHDDAFGLLGVLGEDCPGAVQFLRAERVPLPEPHEPAVTWLTEHELAARLRLLRLPGAPARFDTDAGYFSLAGAQPKIALLRDDGRWGIPGGRTPTTHIIKPPLGGRIGFVVAEHVALVLTRELDLVAAESFVLRAEDEIALAVVRYDRVNDSPQSGLAGWRRVHQEDLCQALGLPPSRKYETQGAPGVAQIVAFLWERSAAAAEDVGRFLDMIVLNWIMVGTDAHARNYSVLIGSGGEARLAPFYDVASVLGCVARTKLPAAKLAMRIGGELAALTIGRSHWDDQARQMHMDPVALGERVLALARRVPDAVQAACARVLSTDDLPSADVERLVARIAARARQCVREFE